MLVIKSTKTDFNTKIGEIEKKISDYDHDKYITTPEFNKLTAESFASRLAQANLATKSDITNFVKKIKELLQIKQIVYLLKMNLKNYRHLTQVFLLVKVT